MARKSISAKGKVGTAGKKAGSPHRARKPDSIEDPRRGECPGAGAADRPLWHAGVTLNLQLLLKHAALIDEFSLADGAEPAPVFRA